MKRDEDTASYVEAAKTGDTEAFERLVREYADAVYGHCLRYFGDAASAEDACQEVFLKVYRSVAGFDGRSSFPTWLYTVTRSVCLDLLRKGKRRPMPMDPLSIPEPATPDFADGLSASKALESAMQALAPEDREALGAVTLMGLSYAEAGRALSVPTGTVKSRVFRARRTLLHLLGSEWAEGGAA